MVYGSEGLIPSSWGGMGQQAQEADCSHHIHGQEEVELTYLQWPPFPSETSCPKGSTMFSNSGFMSLLGTFHNQVIILCSCLL